MSEKRFYSLNSYSLYEGEEYASIKCVKNTMVLKYSTILPKFSLFGKPKLDSYSFVISIENYYKDSYKLVKLYINGENKDYELYEDKWTVVIPRCFLSSCDDMIVLPVKVLRDGVVLYYRYHILSQKHNYRGGINNADLHTAQALSVLISSMLYQFSSSYPWYIREEMKALWETYTVYRYRKDESEYNNMLR